MRIADIQNHREAAVFLGEVENELVRVSGKAAVDLSEDKPAHAALRKALSKAASGLAEARVILETW